MDLAETVKVNVGLFDQFTLLYGMTQGNAISESIAMMLGILEDIQLLSFAFRPEVGFGYMPDWMHKSYLFNPLSYKPHTNSGFAVLFYIALAFLIVNTMLTIVEGFALNGTRIKTVWPLHALRFVTKLKVTILLIPIYEIMIHGFVCHDAEGDVRHMFTDPEKCMSFFQIVIPAAVGIVYLTFKAPLVTLVFLRINPADTTHGSKTTGRIDMVYTLLRFILVIIHEIAADNRISALIATITVISFIMLVLTVRYQIFFNGHANDVRAGIFAASFCSGIQAGICLPVGSYESPAGFAILCVWLMPGFLAGFLASSVARSIIIRRVYRRLKERHGQLESGVVTEGNTILGSKSKIDGSNVIGGSGTLKAPQSITRDFIVKKVDDIVSTVTVKPLQIFMSPADVEMSCRFLQYNKDPEAFLLADSIFDAGIEQYPNQGGLALMKSYYMSNFRMGDLDQVWDYLDLAKSKKPYFDIRFFIFFEERAMEQEDRKEDLMASHLNITGYAELMAMERSARRYHLEAVLALKSLWEYLKSDKVATDCIPFLLGRVDENRRKADRAYRAMLSKYPNSKQVLREDIENAEAREAHGSRGEADEESNADSDNVRRYSGMPGIREMSMAMSQVSEMEADVGTEERNQILSVEAMHPENDRSSVDATLRHRASIAAPVRLGEYPDMESGYPAQEVKTLDKIGNKSLGFAAHPAFADDMTKRVEEAKRKESRTWKAGPGSMNVASAILLGLLIAGCVLSIITYEKITSAVNEAFQRMLPRATLMRLTLYVRLMLTAGTYGTQWLGRPYAEWWELELFRVNEPAKYWIRVFRFPIISLQQFNSYFLMEFLFEEENTLLAWGLDKFFDPMAQLATEVRLWLDNIKENSDALEDMALRGSSDFLAYNNNNKTVMFVLLALIVAASLCVGVFLFRPVLESTARRQVEILSLIHSLPRKYVNEKVDALEVEVENIMEEVEDELAVGAQGVQNSSNTGTIPNESIMGNHSKRKLTKLYAASLILVALTSALMFAPSLDQSVKAEQMIVTIDQLTTRYYSVAGASVLALEIIANDPYAWRPSEAQIWCEQYLKMYDDAHTGLIQSGGGSPSIYDFPSVAAYELMEPLCHSIDTMGCDASVRGFNATIGYTYELVTSSMTNIPTRWSDNAHAFINDPLEQRTFLSPRINFIVGLLEDVADATTRENDLFVADVTKRNNSAKALNIFLFVLALTILILGYFLVFRRMVSDLRNEMLNISQLYFSLPLGMIQSLPELKRFIESGGAVTSMSRKK
ncbi:hypothetical protein HK097_007547 [Rhizophlyctis rosea]|uniref:TmcB/TmcC TPR repeats domain-containing protein n=1 Tax=Rhizophlyctis rosea TaxID=64517 RepID=A0AAD5X1J4_9FUNG|nr:hypothetical protein HK097_007547 [Rhizophlyctis rosea]